MSCETVELVRPDLPRPSCRVILVCGPPGAGKSTLAFEKAGPNDIIIDLDLIAAEFGIGRKRETIELDALLAERNNRLAALAAEPADRTAWVILTAASRCLRQWWRETLGAEELVLLVPSRDELRRRVMLDPQRTAVRHEHLGLIDQWFARERRNDPGPIRSEVDENGFPLDPLHPVNRHANEARQG